jgi:hypothetical protein
MGCGLCHTRESLNEVQNHVSHLSALSDQILERVIPKDDLSLNELDDLFGRSFLLQKICLSMVCRKMVCRCEVHEIPKDGLSLNELDGPNGRSFLLRGQMNFCLSKVCQKMVDRFLVRVIPKDGQSVMRAYARLLNQNRVNRNCGR